MIIAGLVMFFFETGLSAWVPSGIALAGLVILIGLFVLGLSDKHEEVHHTEHHDHHREP